jgi:hypothetical protein
MRPGPAFWAAGTARHHDTRVTVIMAGFSVVITVDSDIRVRVAGGPAGAGGRARDGPTGSGLRLGRV